MESVGPGVSEIRVRVRDEWRVFYVVVVAGTVHVVQRFQKKSRKTRQADVELARRRCRQTEATKMEEPVTESGGDVFTDLGFPPEEASILHMCATLLSDLQEHVRSNSITLEEAAEWLGVACSRVDDLLQGRWGKLRGAALISIKARLGRSVTLQLAA